MTMLNSLYLIKSTKRIGDVMKCFKIFFLESTYNSRFNNFELALINSTSWEIFKDKIKVKFPCNHLYFSENLFYSSIFNLKFVSKFIQSANTEIDIFTWDNERSKINTKFVYESALTEKVLNFIAVFGLHNESKLLNKGSDNVFQLAFRDLLKKMILLKRLFQKRELVEAGWLEAIYDWEAFLCPKSRNLLQRMSDCKMTDLDLPECVIETLTIFTYQTPDPRPLPALQMDPKCRGCKLDIKSNEEVYLECSLFTFNFEEPHLDLETEPKAQKEMMTTCGHMFHARCLTENTVKPEITEYQQSSKNANISLGEIEISDSQSEQVRKKLFHHNFDRLVSGFNQRGIKHKKFYNYFLAPVVNCLRMAKAISASRFDLNMFPWLRQLMLFVFFAHEFNPAIFQMIQKEAQQVSSQFIFWEDNGEYKEALKLVFEVGVESALIRVVVCELVGCFGHQFGVQFASTGLMTVQDQVLQIVDGLLERLFPNFVVLRLSMSSISNIANVGTGAIEENCDGLIWTVLFLRDFLKNCFAETPQSNLQIYSTNHARRGKQMSSKVTKRLHSAIWTT